MSATVALTKTFTVAGFEATVSMPRTPDGTYLSACVEWAPRKPDLHADFTDADRRAYQQRLVAAIVALSGVGK